MNELFDTPQHHAEIPIERGAAGGDIAAQQRLTDEGFALSQSLFMAWDGGSFEDRTYRAFSKAAHRALRRQDTLDAFADAEPDAAYQLAAYDREDQVRP